jgi:hypothetical protein
MDNSRSEIFRHYKRVLDDLIDNSPFFATYLQYPYYMCYDVHSNPEYGIPENITMCGGVTRMCLIDSDYDYVVKFDVNEDARGSACEREEARYKCACKEGLEGYLCEVIYLGEYTKTFNFYEQYEVLSHMRFSEYGAKSEFEEDFFANEYKFGDKNEVEVRLPLYAYRRVEFTRYSDAYSCSKEEEQTIRRYRSPLKDRSLGVAINFFMEYGEEEYKRLSDFLEKMEVNDLHCSNCGLLEGRPIIIDYAGYYESEEEEDGTSEVYQFPSDELEGTACGFTLQFEN